MPKAVCASIAVTGTLYKIWDPIVYGSPHLVNNLNQKNKLISPFGMDLTKLHLNISWVQLHIKCIKHMNEVLQKTRVLYLINLIVHSSFVEMKFS